MRYGTCLAGGIVAGIVLAKYTLPPKVVTKSEVQIVEKEVVKWKDRIVTEQGPTRVVTRTVTVPGPAGPTVTVEKIVEKEKVVTVRDSTGSSATDTKVEEKTSKVVDARPWAAVEALGAVAPGGRWAGAGSVQFRILGPLWLGPGVVKADEWYIGAAARMEF